MKKQTLFMLTVIIMSIIPTHVSARTHPVKPPVENSSESIRLTKRLEEIKNIDVSELNRNEKKELRKEVKTIEKQLKQNNGGVYLSVGAIIIVVLLLIILL
jgi:hypothetical protein